MNILIAIWQTGFVIVAGVFVLAIYSEEFNQSLCEHTGEDFTDLLDFGDEGIVWTIYTLCAIAIVAAIWPFIITQTMVEK